MRDKKIDMLQGSIWDKLMLFALPLAATGILQQFFNAADVAIIGRFVGKTAMAAVGSNSPVVGLLVNGFVGISIGANVVLSKHTGEDDKQGVSDALHTAILFSFFGGIVMAIIGELIAPIIIHILGVPDDVFAMSLTYLRVYMLGLPVIFLYNFEAAIFRSQGDTRTPLICLTFSGASNVLLNLFFVCVVGMQVAGVALATALSNLLCSAMLFFLLIKRRDLIRLYPSKLRIYKKELVSIIRIGLPAGLQSMVFSISNMIVQSAINSLGSDVMAASSAAFNVEIFAYYMINSFGQAATTFVGQNYGAQNLPRCRQVTRIALLLDIIISAIIAFPLLYFGPALLGLFNTDPVIQQYGMIRLTYILSFESVSAIMEIMSGSMRGYGNSTPPAVMTFLGVCTIRILWVYTIFAKAPSFGLLMKCYPVSWILTATALVIAYLRYVNKLNAQGRG